MVDTKQDRWVYRVAQNFCGCLFLRIGHFFCFAETNFCDQVLWSKSVTWLWDGVILLLSNFVSFPRLSDFTHGLRGETFEVFNWINNVTERKRTCWLKLIDSRKSRFRVVCERAIVLWGLKLWNKPSFCLKLWYLEEQDTLVFFAEN